MTAALVAADSPPPPDDGLPPGQPYVSPDDLASIPPLFEAAAQQALLPLVAQIWQESAGTVHAQLVDAAQLPNLPSVSSLAAETYLAQAANTFAQVGDDLWNTARSELLAGFQAGESIPQLSDRLRNSAGLTARKATLVARTQVLDASNAGSYATAQASGLELKKGWLDTPDQRTRPTHRVAGAAYGSDEQMIPLADQFVVGGYSCDRPHDPTLPAAERYSCRCSLIYSMGPAAVKTAQDEAEPAPPLPNTSGQPVPVLPVEVTPAEAAAAQAAKIGEAVGSPPVTRQLAHQAELTPRAMADLDAVHIPGLGTPDGDAYLAAKNGAAHAYYTPLGSHPSVYATAQASAENPLPAIWFNPHWNGNRLGGVVRKGIDSGWYTPAPPGLAPLERTLAHEYGHHVTNVLFESPNFNGTADMAGAIAERILGPINEALGANRISTFTTRNGEFFDLLQPIQHGFEGDLHFSLSGDLLDEWVRQNKDLITAKVSGYAAKNFDEFLAEVWQEYSTMGAAARPHIQTIGALLREVTEELRAGGGTLRTAVEVTQLAEAPLSARTVIQLRALAKQQGIPGYSKLTKPQLVERLSAAPGAPPAAVVEVPLSARRIAELRTLAKQRGLIVPPRATKADLIRALEAPPKTEAELNALKRAAARERNKLIESRAAAEQTLAELDDLLFKKATREAFEQRIALAQLDPADLAALRAALDDPVKLRAQVTRISKKQGITVAGKAGAKVKFDPETMDPVGDVPAPGTPMVVIRRGSTVTVDGEQILLNKAVVKLPTAPVKKAAKAAAPKKATQTVWSKPKTGEDALSAPRMDLAKMGDDDPRTSALWYRVGDNSLETETGRPGAFDMGDQLRSGRLDPAMKKRVAAIDSVMAESPLGGPIEVYRGIELESIFRDWENVVGKTFRDRNFVSTSTDAAHASNFGTVMRLRVPSGIRAIRMADRDPDMKESEILLDRNLRFRIVAQYGRGELKGPWGGARVIDVEIVQ